MQPINNLLIGAKVKFGKYQVEAEPREPIIWLIADKNHSGYPTNSVTLLTERIIDVRGFDAKEPSNSDSDRQASGNNRYRDSNIRQWLNKAGLSWFQKTHSADEPPTDDGMSQPTGYNNKEGFLSSFTDDELNAILDTTLTVARNTKTDGGGSEVVTDKVFLLSNTEVGLANENSIVEGSLLPIFSDDASRVAYPTKQAADNSNYTSLDPDTAGTWWLRTPRAADSRGVRHVNTSGTLNNGYAFYGNHGVRPALNLISDILVSDTVDGDGCYTVIWQMPYAITLDKPISVQSGEMLEKVKFNPKINNKSLNLKSTDAEKLIYTAENLNTDTVDLEIEGKDGKIDKIAYTID